MTDPFTDEDVKRALAAYDPGLANENYPQHAVESFRNAMRLALLAGTERLRTQGTWNEAIEAAAKTLEPKKRIKRNASSGEHGRKADACQAAVMSDRKNMQRNIRALARKETP